MKKLIWLFLTGTCMISASEAQEVTWQRIICGDSIDYAKFAKQTTDGGFILAGGSCSDSSCEKSENMMGQLGWKDFWIVKTDSFGNIQWENTVGANQDEQLNAIQQTSDGGYILGGYTTADISGDKTEVSNSPTLNDYWIVKLDANGNVQWDNGIGGNGDDRLYALIQTSDGGYLAGGWSGSDSSGDKTADRIGYSADYWIVKMNSLGVVQWDKTIGGSQADLLTGIIETPDGGFLLAGSSLSPVSGTKTEGTHGDYDYWIVKIDSLGTIVWQNDIGASLTDKISSVTMAADGGFLLGGTSSSGVSFDKTEINYGSNDFWIVKTDSLGNVEWDRTLGGSLDDLCYTVNQMQDGGFLIGGGSPSNISGTKTENKMSTFFSDDCWLIKTDANGSIEWQNTIGGNGPEDLYNISLLSNGDLLLGCMANGWGGDIADSTDDQDMWILRITTHHNVITGTLYIDSDSNLVQDVSEPPLIHRRVTDLNTGIFTFTDQNGHYQVTLTDSGNYFIAVPSLNNYSKVPASHSGYFNGLDQTDSTGDFAFQPNGWVTDLSVNITPAERFRPGRMTSYYVTYENAGTLAAQGTVVFFPDDGLSFQGSDPSPISITTDSVVWDVGLLSPFQRGNINILVRIDTNLVLNAIVNSYVRIDPVVGDAFPSNNYSAREAIIMASFDPNNIDVDEDTLFTSAFPNPPFLDYIIYFQNTGNDTAFDIKILNPIDTSRLDLSTLEFIASSHPCNLFYTHYARNLEFHFGNILLPDSNIDEAGSHGFVRYHIKPVSTLIAGNQILNTAYIYFDFNAPVQTDTALTRILLPVQISGPVSGAGGFVIYPNPAGEKLNVRSHLLIIEGIDISDVRGMKIISQKPHANQAIIDVSFLSSGLYFISLMTSEGVTVYKFVKD